MRSGLRVPSNTVPAVKDVCPWHPRQCNSPRDVTHGSQSIGSVGKQTRPANATDGYSPGIRRRSGTTHPSPETSADNQPRRRGVRCHRAQNLSRCTSHQAIIPANWSEGDTQFAPNGIPFTPVPEFWRSESAAPMMMR